MLRRRRPPKDIRDRCVVITGASSGIGLATARQLDERGARLALVARGDEALRQVAASMTRQPVVTAADVARADEIEQALERSAAALGGLDAVVVNAGAAAYGPFTQMEPDDYVRTLQITLLGALHTTHAGLPHLERSGGTLVFVGSVAGRLALPWLSAYAAAKHGIRGFARSLHAELHACGSPVRVALIAPGPVDTPFWRRARSTDRRRPPRLVGVYRPEDVAAEVLRAIEAPRLERTVGGLFVPLIVADALLPNLSLRAVSSLAKLGWRRRGEKLPQPGDALADPTPEPELEGNLPSRTSVLRKLRDLVNTRQ